MYDSAVKITGKMKVPPYQRLITGLARFKAGYRTLRPAGSGDVLLMLTVAGEGFFRRNEHVEHLNKGDIAIIPLGIPHDYGTMPQHRAWSVVWTHFQPWPHWEALTGWPRTPSGALVLKLHDPAVYADVESNLRRMHAEASSAHPHRAIRAMNRLEQALLLCDQLNPLQSANRGDPRIQAAVDHVHTHLAEPVSIDELAVMASLSPSRFAHLFTSEKGVSPLQYVEMQRINRARDLLAVTFSPVAEVGEAVGYPDPYYFSRRFRKATGLSPRAYRRAVGR